MSTAGALTSVQPAAADAFAMSSGRLVATVAGVLGLVGVVVGGWALARRGGRAGPGRLGGGVAVAAGLVAVALGGLVVLTAEGGVGSGNGLGGGVVAGVLGLVALVLGGSALARGRHADAPRRVA